MDYVRQQCSDLPALHNRFVAYRARCMMMGQRRMVATFTSSWLIISKQLDVRWNSMVY
jgi:hypothetical protein